jgi:hypothetical protein
MKFRLKAILFVSVCFYLIFVLIALISLQDESWTYLSENTSKQSEETKKYVLMSCSTSTSIEFYMFHIPLAALAWLRVGFEPLVLIVSSDLNMTNKFTTKSVQFLKSMNVKVQFVKADEGYEILTSMVIRLFAGTISLFGNEDFILTTDVDLIPIRQSYYKMDANFDVHIWNAFCCGTFFHDDKLIQMFPMSHVGMKKSIWKRLMNPSDKAQSELGTGLIIESIKSTFNSSKGGFTIKKDQEVVVGDENWYIDQKLLSININHLIENSDLKLALKKYEGIRADRWARNDSLFDREYFHLLTDFHSFHYDFKNKWFLMKRLFESMFDRELNQKIETFSREFFELSQI